MTDFLTSAEVATLTRRSLRTIRTLTAAGRIPHRKMSGSRRVLYPKSEVLAWLDGSPLEIVVARDGGRVCRPQRLEAS